MKKKLLADEPFAKALRVFEPCVTVINISCRKLALSLEFPLKFYEKFKVALVPFFIPDFGLLSCELDNFTFKVLHLVISF